jgi:hypothetical protein
MAGKTKKVKIVEILDRNLQLCREFMNDWLLFNQILSAFPSPGVNKAQLENQFLKIKSKLAREHQVIKEQLGADYKLDGNTMNIISGATNLESIYAQSEVAIKKLQNEWHRAFISINETLGGLEDKRARAESGERVVAGPYTSVSLQGKGMSAKSKKNILAVIIVIAVLALLMLVPPVRDLYMGALNDLGIIDRPPALP